MAKKRVIIECPHCHRINDCEFGFFKRKVKCECGTILRFEDFKVVTKECETCGNLIVYNREQKDPICPICKSHLIKPDDSKKFIEVVCQECHAHVTVKKDDNVATCPICENTINVQEAIKKQKHYDKGQPNLLKAEFGPQAVVVKHQLEDFRLGSQIIVNESQTAVFLANGKAVGIYGPGAHTIEKDNVYLSKTNYSDDNVTFHSQLFFVSNTLQTGLRWGTDSKVRLFDPATGLHVELGASGTYNFKISNVEKFLFHVIGVSVNFGKNAGILTNDAFVSMFRPNIVSVVKTYLARVIKDNAISVLELDENTALIAKRLHTVINEEVEKFGIELTDFIILNIVTPDDDPNFRRLKEQHAAKFLRVNEELINTDIERAKHDRLMAEAINQSDVKLMNARTEAELERIRAAGKADAYTMQARAEADEMKMKGYTYNDETRRMVSREAVGSGMLEANQGGGFGGGSFSSMAQDMAKAQIIKTTTGEIAKEFMGAMNGTTPVTSEPVVAATPADNGWKCPECGNEGIKTNFCPECGAKKPAPVTTWDCPTCGATGIKTKFCPECGAKRPEAPTSWICPDCGTKDITTKFCPECGHKRD